MQLEDLEIYTFARELSRDSWEIYSKLDWHQKKIMGDQFIRAVDSIGANIAEGFGRYHYLDKNKFNYNARGSLLESLYWLEVLEERGTISNEHFETLKNKFQMLHRRLNGYISSTREQSDFSKK